jgi:regulatory protein
LRVTAIERQRRRQRANVFIDGRPALSLSLEVLAQSGLRLDDELDASRLEELRHAQARHAALASALRLLSYRPRASHELESRLGRRFSPQTVAAVLERLKELGLVDDAAFARFWVETRAQASPRGRRLLWQELAAKGIDRDTVREALAPLDERQAAYRAAEKKARSLQGLEFPDFRQRLGDFLLRRGFDYEVVRETVTHLWRQIAASAASPEES